MSIRYMTIYMMSDLTGIDRRTIKKRIEGLVGQKGAKNGFYYDMHEALPLIYHPQGTKLDINRSMANESLLHERAKRERMELDVKRIRGEYISIEEVCKSVEKEYSFVRSQLRALPSKLAKPLSIMMNPHDVQKTIEESVNECLEELVSDKQYEALKNEIDESRIQIDPESKKDDAANSSVEPSGVGGSIQISEPGIKFDSGEMEDQYSGSGQGSDASSDRSKGKEDNGDGSDAASEDGTTE